MVFILMYSFFCFVSGKHYFSIGLSARGIRGSVFLIRKYIIFSLNVVYDSYRIFFLRPKVDFFSLTLLLSLLYCHVRVSKWLNSYKQCIQSVPDELKKTTTFICSACNCFIECIYCDWKEIICYQLYSILIYNIYFIYLSSTLFFINTIFQSICCNILI